MNHFIEYSQPLALLVAMVLGVMWVDLALLGAFLLLKMLSM